MNLPTKAFAPGHLNRGPNAEFISKISIENGKLIDNYFEPIGHSICTKKGEEILVNPSDCEWLSQSFFRNENVLYGLTCSLKSASTKVFLTPIKTNVDFNSFEVLNFYFAKDKTRFYYGPGARVINEKILDLFFDNTYQKEWEEQNSDAVDHTYSLWKSKVALSEDKVYWHGRLVKGLHSSLKRITPFYYCDDFNVYEFDLQKLKLVQGFDRSSMVYFNKIKNNSIHGFVTDLEKPAYRHSRKETINERYDYKDFKSFFESHRNSLSPEYWWYKLELDH